MAGAYGHHPSWTPDSRHVIFAGQKDESLVCQVHIVVVDEEKVRARFGAAAMLPEKKA